MQQKPLESILGRNQLLFNEDLKKFSHELHDQINGSRFLVLGGAGSIGSSVITELLRFKPRSIDIVDLNENSLADLIRNLRSQNLVGKCQLDTFVLDIGSKLFQKFCENVDAYDYVFNLSAIKHVRSEKDAYTLARMIEVNIINTVVSYKTLNNSKTRKYFCVSTDKATNPENLMGATKRIMETFLPAIASNTSISTARFANVAFSNGSLLSSFIQRINKRQPLAAPNDILRYFVSEKEAGILCLFSGILGGSDEIFFPMLSESIHAIGFDQIAIELLASQGFEPEFCASESEALQKVHLIEGGRKWPVFFSASDTSGEKKIEEFQYSHEINKNRFFTMGVVDNLSNRNIQEVDSFIQKYESYIQESSISKTNLVKLITQYCPELIHEDKSRNLNDKL